MRQRTAIGLALMAALSISACFYESPVPITAPSGKLAFDSTLVGGWKLFDSDDGDTIIVTIVGFDQTSQVVHYSEPDHHDQWPDDRVHLYFRAHTTQLGKARFLNLEILGEKERKYWFFRYVQEGDVLRVRALKEKMAEGLTTSAKLKAFLQANLENETIYDKWIEFKRIAGPTK